MKVIQMAKSVVTSHSLARRMVLAFWVSVPAYLSLLFILLGNWVSRFLGRRVSKEKSSFNQKSIIEPYRARPSLPDPDIKPGTVESVFTSRMDYYDDDDDDDVTAGKPIVTKDEQSPPSFLQFRFQTYDQFIELNRGNDSELNYLRGSAQKGFEFDSPESVHQVIVRDQSDLSSRDDTEGRSVPITKHNEHSTPEITSPPPVITQQDDEHHSAETDSPRIEHHHRDNSSITAHGHEPSNNSQGDETGIPNDNRDNKPTHSSAEEPKEEEEENPNNSDNFAVLSADTPNEDQNSKTPVFLLNHDDPDDDDDDDFAVSSDSDSEDSIASSSSSCGRSSNFSIRSSLIDSVSDETLHDIDFSVVRIDLSYVSSLRSATVKSKPNKIPDASSGQDNFDDVVESKHHLTEDDDDADVLAELKRIEEEETAAAEEELRNMDENRETTKTSKKVKFVENVESIPTKLCDEDDDDDDDVGREDDHPNAMEKEWEHQELIEQLKMEMRKVRDTSGGGGGGLPTIFEESESFKVSDDDLLKPWKIEDHAEEVNKFVNVGDEIHKFYKSYRERMRKLDIFNYQKMYAIGFLRLKDPHQSLSNLDATTTTTLITQDHCWPFHSSSSSSSSKQQTSDPKFPILKLRRDLENDLETVYVSQLCLSWEFLHWQYEKALSLWDADPRSTRTYNEVAGEFQQFQVLIQRYLEDEPFQGSTRVQSFVKCRCINRHILQVPLIREDNAKQRKMVSGKDSITSLMLVEMIEESIRVLWRFIRTDKDAKTKGLLRCSRKTTSNIELQNPDDAELLVEVEANLRKKYKKLRDAMRSECCILKKLQRHLGDELLQVGVDEVSCFFSQVDLKLVSRVLSMSRLTTEQLGWCSGKLNTVKIVNNRIRIDPSFLLFPC